MIFGWGQMQLGTAATGEVDVSWPRGATRRVSGKIGVDLAERADGRVPLSGRLDWRAEDGTQIYDRALLVGPGMSGSVTGEVDPEDRARLEVAGETGDLAATETVLTRVRRALGNPEAQPAGFTGRGGFRGSWRGTVDWPVFEGRFAGDGVGYAGVDWGHAEWTGTLDTAAESVDSRPLVLRKGAGEIRWEGRTEIGWFGLKDAIDGRARADRVAGRGPRDASWSGTSRPPASSAGRRWSAGGAARRKARRAAPRATAATTRFPSPRRASSRAGEGAGPR